MEPRPRSGMATGIRRFAEVNGFIVACPSLKPPGILRCVSS